jgi:hypothetical protein
MTATAGRPRRGHGCRSDWRRTRREIPVQALTGAVDGIEETA